MQIKALHKNIYKLSSYALYQEKLYFYSNMALILLTPEEELSSFMILK